MGRLVTHPLTIELTIDKRVELLEVLFLDQIFTLFSCIVSTSNIVDTAGLEDLNGFAYFRRVQLSWSFAGVAVSS